MAKYLLAKQSTELELVTDYVGWSPYPFDNWKEFIENYSDEELGLTIKTPYEAWLTTSDLVTDSTSLFLETFHTRGDFPPEAQDDLKDWQYFWIVSTQEIDGVQFIIPAH